MEGAGGMDRLFEFPRTGLLLDSSQRDSRGSNQILKLGGIYAQATFGGAFWPFRSSLGSRSRPKPESKSQKLSEVRKGDMP